MCVGSWNLGPFVTSNKANSVVVVVRLSIYQDYGIKTIFLVQYNYKKNVKIEQTAEGMVQSSHKQCSSSGRPCHTGGWFISMFRTFRIFWITFRISRIT